jgi:small conductance mechanosensitive channel
MRQMLDDFIAGVPAYLATPARVLLILLLAGIALRLIPRLISRLRRALQERQDSAEDARRIHTLSRVIRYVVTVVVTVVAGIVILGEFGVSVAPILGAAGVVGIALGFGAQSLVKDYFTGFFLLLENQIRIGDIVEAGGKGGVVEELTLRYLRLRDYEGNVHYIPNGAISVVTNRSLGYAYAVVDAGVAYGEDVDRVIEVMRRVGEELRQDGAFSAKILDALEVAGVDRWADSAVVIRCRFKVMPLEQWNVRREFLRRLKMAFDEEGIEIPFPHVKLVAPPAKE